MHHVLQTATAIALAVAVTIFAADAQTTMSPAAAPSPEPVANPAAPAPVNPPENPLVTNRVRQEFSAWQRGHIDRASYTPYAGGTNIDALVAQVQPNLVAIGAPQSVTYETTSLLFGDFVYRYDVTGPLGVISVLYSLNDHGKTDGIIFTPQIFAEATPVPTPAPSPLP